MYPHVFRLSVCRSVTLVHPAKAFGRNEMPFGRDTGVVQSNTVLDRVPGPPWEGEIWGVGTQIMDLEIFRPKEA